MRLIDVDKLKPDAEYNAWDKKFTAYSVKQIEKAVVEVVHCKDCQFAKPTNIENIFWCILWKAYTWINHYCSEGERKDNE